MNNRPIIYISLLIMNLFMWLATSVGIITMPTHSHVCVHTYTNTQTHRLLAHIFHAYHNPYSITSYGFTEMKSIWLLYLIQYSQGVSFQSSENLPWPFYLLNLPGHVCYLPCSASARFHLTWYWWCYRRF